MDFKYVCIGSSSKSPVGVEIGKVVDIEYCMKQRCSCGYVESLKLVLIDSFGHKSDKIEIARSLLVEKSSPVESPEDLPVESPEDSPVEKKEEQKEKVKQEETKKGDQKTKKRKRKGSKDGDLDEIQRMLFGE